MTTELIIIGVIAIAALVISLISLKSGKDSPTKAEFTEVNNTVKQHSKILRKSKA